MFPLHFARDKSVSKFPRNQYNNANIISYDIQIIQELKNKLDT